VEASKPKALGMVGKRPSPSRASATLLNAIGTLTYNEKAWPNSATDLAEDDTLDLVILREYSIDEGVNAVKP